MNDYTNDFLTPLCELLSNSVKDDFSPLEFSSLSEVINKLGFQSLQNLIYSMFTDKDNNVVGNYTCSLFITHLCSKNDLIDNETENILKKTGLLIEKHMARFANSAGIGEQAAHIKDNAQKQSLAENFMYPEIKDLELFFNNVNILWELEKEKFEEETKGNIKKKKVEIVIDCEIKDSGNIYQQTNSTSDLENDYTLSTIEDFLHPFEKIISPKSFKDLREYLKEYFDNGKFPIKTNEIKVGKVNSKALGWALYEIYKALKTNKEKLTYEYLHFGKKNISIFKNVELTETNMNKCTLYKYYTSKTSMK